MVIECHINNVKLLEGDNYHYTTII